MSERLHIADASQIAAARRQAVALAQSLGFDETAAGKAALVATEACTNLLKHAGQGEIILGETAGAPVAGVEILAVDGGPGIDDIGRSLTDGYSTAGSSGTGLGAIRRLSGQFSIYSRPGAGTVLMARLFGRKRSAKPSLEIGGLSVAMPGQTVCGDAWSYARTVDGVRILVADGLGHGGDAAVAGNEAVAVFQRRAQAAPTQIIESIHAALGKTRGAAVALADLDFDAGKVVYAGLGNIAGSVLTGTEHRKMVSQNGTAGVAARRIASFDYPLMPTSILVMHSDGISSRWGLDAYPGLAACHPSVIAGVLLRDFGRGRDDATVVVARAARP